MCFGSAAPMPDADRIKSRIRVDDLIDGLNLRIMTDDSARAKVAREGLATIVWHPGDLLPGSALGPATNGLTCQAAAALKRQGRGPVGSAPSLAKLRWISV